MPPTLEEYEAFIYALPTRYPVIQHAVLSFIGEEKRYWYDSWLHPHLAELAATDPHHKHVPPDLKHHRMPAPDLSFVRPNLPFLIEEIAQTLLAGS